MSSQLRAVALQYQIEEIALLLSLLDISFSGEQVKYYNFFRAIPEHRDWLNSKMAETLIRQNIAHVCSIRI